MTSEQRFYILCERGHVFDVGPSLQETMRRCAKSPCTAAIVFSVNTKTAEGFPISNVRLSKER